jgi:amidophosphoribosyltransferase
MRVVPVSELHHECGVAAIYHLPGAEAGQVDVARLVPRMLLDMQNRGQLSAGMTAWNPDRNQLLVTHKDVGSVSEVFRMSQRNTFESLMHQLTGRAAIGHVRYATCGADDPG